MCCGGTVASTLIPDPALSPSRCVMLAGNAKTRAALEQAGVEVIEYAGTEISVKGAGGPTCLTRPLVREAV